MARPPPHIEYQRQDLVVTFVEPNSKGVSLSVLSLQPLFPPALLPWGIMIKSVEAGGQAERLGLRRGDVIKAANGVQLTREPDEAADP